MCDLQPNPGYTPATFELYPHTVCLPPPPSRSYMAAAGLFCPDPATGAKRLGGYDPQHAQKMADFAKAMLWTSQSIKNPLGETVQVRGTLCVCLCVVVVVVRVYVGRGGGALTL